MAYSWLATIGGAGRADAQGEIASGLNNQDNGDDLFNDGSNLGSSPAEGEIQKLAQELGLKLNASTKDYLLQYYFNEKSRQNAFADSMHASNTQYQRAVEDLKKAGLNPFLVLSGLNATAPTSSSNGVSGGAFVQQMKNQKDQENKVLSILAMVALGVLAFL